MSLQEKFQELWFAIQQLFVSLWQLISFLLHPVFLVPALIIAIILIKQNLDYKKTAYYRATKLSLHKLKCDRGKYGEYLIYKRLKNLELRGARFLFNAYIPKADGNTSEIDVLMICSKGIFVFESKNYKGWIFGSESQKNWYQTLPMGRHQSQKESFYNPIMQNQSHVLHLKAVIGDHLPIWSMVVFSDRCTLKNGQIVTEYMHVRYLSQVLSAVLFTCQNQPQDRLTEGDIANLYDQLYPFTQVSYTLKEQHVISIHQNQAHTIVAHLPTYDTLRVSEQDQNQTLQHIQLAAKKRQEESETSGKLSNELPGIDVVNREQRQSNTQICPRCQGKLVLRTATRGTNVGKQFYGCINYPRCKYIQNLD